MKSLLLLLIFPLSALAAPAVKLPVPDLETLPNGLQLAWFASEQLPVVDLALLVRSGYRDDPAGKSGVAQLVSDCLDRGVAGLSAQQFARAVEMLGASRYASADDDTFTVGMHGLSQDAGVLLGLLGKLVTTPDFPAAEVAREHDRILDRWKHVGDYGESLAGLTFQRVMAADTSYGRGSFISAREFSGVGRGDVLAFHRDHFTPKNSILMIVGRVNRPEFRKAIVTAFGGWQGEVPKRAYKPFRDSRLLPKNGPVPRGEILLVDRASLTQAQVRIGFPAPLIDTPEHYGLVVANALLGEYFHSRLNTIVRDKLGLTYGISSSFSYSRDFARFIVTSSTANETVGALVLKTREILEGLKKEPISAEETTQAKDYLVGGFPLSVSTLGAVASRWLAGSVFGLGPSYLNEFVPKISAIKSEDVTRAVAAHFPLDRMTIVVAGNAKAVEKSLRGSGFSKIRRFTVKDLL